MTFILDTNIISDLRKAYRNPQLRQWFDAQAAETLFISAITILELEIGVARVERRDTLQGCVLRDWLDRQVAVSFSDRILGVDAQVARRAAHLHVPDPQPERDALIAATALVHDKCVVTRNISDFKTLGVSFLNPWDL